MVTTKYRLGIVISFNPDHGFGFIRDRFDGHQAHFRMSAARHFTLMGGVLIHYTDRSVSIPKPDKGDLVIFQEMAPKSEDLKPEVTVFFYAFPAIEVMRDDWIRKHDRCACEHLFSDHQNLGTWCTKCECGHEPRLCIGFDFPWPEEEEKVEICGICGHPEHDHLVGNCRDWGCECTFGNRDDLS